MNTKHTPRNQMTGVRMVGGIDIEESTLSDDANYWRMGANGAAKRIETMLPDCERAIKIIDTYWNSYNTWKTICLKTERVRDLIKALCHV